MRLISDSAHTADQEACPDCGLAYVHDSPSDQRLHADIHDEVVNGASAWEQTGMPGPFRRGVGR